VKLSSSLFSAILVTAFAVLQSVFFRHGLVAGITPDFALIILIFSSVQHGCFKAQTTGFISGIVQDLLSVTPLGFHALTRTLIGYLYGHFKGKLFIDPILVPMLLAAVGTLLKAVFGFFIFSIFSQDHAAVVFTAGLGVEIGLNTLAAPFLFGLLKLIGVFRAAREER
jgi:rod shape-determining protein MreD